MGIFFSLATAFLWALSPLCFASAGRRIGSFAVAWLRVALASVLLVGLLPAYSALFHVSLHAPAHSQLGWMALSGFLGVGIGDLMIYRALVLIGAEKTTQILLVAPLASMLAGSWLLRETLSVREVGGAVVILVGTAWALRAGRAANPDGVKSSGDVAGWVFAFAGAICVGLGAVTGRLAFQSGPGVDSVLMASIRVWSAAIFIGAIALVKGEIRSSLALLNDRFARGRLVAGTIAGPFLGMICYVSALRFAPAGLVSTLVATSPLFVLPVVALRRRTPIRPGVAVAVLVAVVGVGMVCL